MKRGHPAVAAPSAGAPLRPSVKAKRSRWKDNSLIIYGLPSLLVLALVLYLTLTPSTSPPTSSSRSHPQPRTPPAVLHSTDADPNCRPLSVLDDADAHMRILRCGDCVLGGEYLSANISIFTSSYVQASVALANTLHPRPSPSSPSAPTSSPSPPPTFLIIGLGAGHVASIFQNLFGMRGDVVERSEAVVEVAARYFHFLPSRRVHRQSAEEWVASLHFDEASGSCRLRGEYDVVAVDIFDASNQLSSLSLYTLPSLSALACTLSPRGLLSVSLVYSRKPLHLRSPHSLYLTLASLFPHVIAYHDGAGSTDDVGNMVFIASHAAFRLDMASLPLPEDFSEEVDVEGQGTGDGEGRLALQYAFGFWRDQLKRRRFQWKDKQPQTDGQGKPLYSPVILTGQLATVPHLRTQPVVVMLSLTHCCTRLSSSVCHVWLWWCCVVRVQSRCCQCSESGRSPSSPRTGEQRTSFSTFSDQRSTIQCDMDVLTAPYSPLLSAALLTRTVHVALGWARSPIHGRAYCRASVASPSSPPVLSSHTSSPPTPTIPGACECRSYLHPCTLHTAASELLLADTTSVEGCSDQLYPVLGFALSVRKKVVEGGRAMRGVEGPKLRAAVGRADRATDASEGQASEGWGRRGRRTRRRRRRRRTGATLRARLRGEGGGEGLERGEREEAMLRGAGGVGGCCCCLH